MSPIQQPAINVVIFAISKKGLIAVSGKRHTVDPQQARNIIAAQLSRQLKDVVVDDYYGKVMMEVFVENGRLVRCVTHASRSTRLT